MKKLTCSTCPYIVANSADIDDSTERKCEAVGFDDVFRLLKFEDIDNVLMPEIERRRAVFKRKVDEEINDGFIKLGVLFKSCVNHFLSAVHLLQLKFVLSFCQQLLFSLQQSLSPFFGLC